MDAGDHADTNDEQDSFDDFSVTEKNGKKLENSEELEDEEENEEQEMVVHKELDLEEEDFDVVTIEKVPLKVLTTRIGRIISEVMYRGEPAAIALFDVANKIVFQSSILGEQRNTVIEILIHGLTRIITDEREKDERAEQAEHFLLLFVTKLAVKSKSVKCDDLLMQLIRLIDHMYLHADSFVRLRIVRLTTLLVDESNRYTEAMREHGDDVYLFTDDKPAEAETMVPEAVLRRWMERLAKSLLDKSPQVRSSAVVGLSHWEHDAAVRTAGGETTVNQLLWKSVHDVDESVRLAAARRVHIVDASDIDKCMDYVETSKENRIRQAVVVRLASDVHLFSLSNEQKFRLVNLLNNSDSARVQDVIHQKLVESWMTVAGAEITGPSIFPKPKPGDCVPNEFPSLILEYLDPLVDQNAVYVFMKFATARFIQMCNQNSDSVDVEQFMKDLLKLSESEIESVGVMKRTTFRLLEEEEDVKKTFARIFVTRCFLDVVFQLSQNRINCQQLRNRALAFFTPDVTTFCDEVELFVLKYFTDRSSDSQVPEDLLYNLIHLLNVSVKHGDNDFDKEIYRKTLKKILENDKLHFAPEVIATIVTVILDLSSDLEKSCLWLCETANRLLVAGDHGVIDLAEAMKKGVIADRTYMKSAMMLLATCQHEEVLKPTAEMSQLFRALIPALLGNQTGTIQMVGLELIGYAAAIDFDNCGPYLKLTRFLILRDDALLKSTGLHTLIRVVKSHGFGKTAKSIFDDQEQGPGQESLAKLIEQTIVGLEGVFLMRAVHDCFSMLSHGRYAWPKLMSALLLIVFQKSNEHLQLVRIFKMYCRASVKSLWNKINLVQGFNRTISVISKTRESDANWSLTEMTSTICEHLSSVHTIGEDDEEEKKRNSNSDANQDIHVEVELAQRMVSRAVSHPTGWFIKHVFNSLASSLSLGCVPVHVLVQLNENLVDAYTVVRFNSAKPTQIAFKRFMTQCEKVITLQKRLKGMPLDVDLKKVKNEEENNSNEKKSAKSSNSKTTNPWDNEEVESENSFDDSFEYQPRSTRTRKRQNSSTSHDSPKKSRKNGADQNLDDSFEL